MKKALAILLVEDDESDAELVRRALKGCNLSVASNGRQALDYLHRLGEFREVGKPDLILLDINMPGMGWETIAKKYKTRRGP
jgi:CheY-like chemotaxis protein